MISWLTENAGTILISLVLLAVVTGIIFSMVKDKKQGKSTCGGSCAHCGACAACASKKEHNEI